ncbi:MAG: glycogen debranching N-terminal domain-containing protein [Phycisphaerales bacterium]
MDEIVSIEDRHYILAGSSLADHRTLVLKQGDTFAVFGASGDVESLANHEQGLFTAGMRHLSRLEVRLLGKRPLLLSSAVSRDNSRIFVDLTNPDMAEDGRVVHARGTVHLSRSKHLRGGACFERFILTNFGNRPVEASLAVGFEADFADIFEVRGAVRPGRGRLAEPEITGDASVVAAYEGLDGVLRRTRFELEPAPASLSPGHARYRVGLGPGERAEFFLTIRTSPESAGAPPPPSYRHSVRLRARDRAALGEGFCGVTSSDARLNQWVRRSLADVRMLRTETAEGPYPYAGIPWYCCPFGRDGIIAAMQLLWISPGTARGVLSFLAAHQAGAADAENDAEPGKILHEWRDNEMANTREVPFGRYYGTVDATPLFVALAGMYWGATGDRALCGRLWAHVERALSWIDRSGDLDGDGFVEYQCKARGGLSNQGWKDSHDAVFHADGSPAEPPIALCEVQGYVYDAKSRAAVLARALGHVERADELEHQARILRGRFHEFFWCEGIGTYALALDGHKRQCCIRTSNAGHALFTGIADAGVAGRVAAGLMDEPMFSGWGVRTVGEGEARYNPMAYHNGSVWPHDNSLIAMGMSRYGHNEHALRLLRSFLEASTYVDLQRLPELFCGFGRRSGSGPTQYPVACSPQAWAAGSVFMLLAAALGLTVDGARGVVRVNRPLLPPSVRWLRVTGLRVGAGELDLEFLREAEDVSVVVRRRAGGARVIVEK